MLKERLDKEYGDRTCVQSGGKEQKQAENNYLQTLAIQR